MTSRLLLRAAVMALVVRLSAPIAHSQSPLAGPPTPTPPLVGSAAFRRLDFNVGLYEGYDMMRAFGTSSGLAVDPRFVSNTSFLTASGALTLTTHSQKLDFSLTGGANARHYSVAGRVFPVDYYGGVNLSRQVGERVRIRASGSGSYSPYFAFGTFMTPRVYANALVPPSPDRDVSRLDTYMGAMSGGLSWLTGRHTTVDVGYSADLVETSNPAYETRSHGGQASLSHRMTRYSSLRVGYGLRQYRYGVQTRTLQVHTIDTGFGYSRPLSFSRHTTVGFGVGSAVAGHPHVDAYTFYVTGSATLSHQLSRRWALVGDYRRDVSTFAGSEVPYLSDGVTGALTGVLTQKLGLAVSGGYLGGGAVADVENGYGGWTGTANLRYRLRRYVPIFVEYVFYQYTFDGLAGLAPGFPFLTNRHGIRAGLSYSVPIVGRRVA